MLWAAVALLGFCQIFAAFVIVFGVRTVFDRRIQAARDEISSTLAALGEEWLTPAAEGEPHKLAKTVALVGDVIGASAARSIMASLNADKSHVANVANGITDGIVANQNPLLGLLSGGRRGKGAALQKLMEVIGPKLMGMAGSIQGNGNGGAPQGEYTGRRHRD